MSHRLTSCNYAVGLRVKHGIDGRYAMIIDRPEHGAQRLVPVHVEGSTRRELWPWQHVVVRRKRDQHLAMGGRYQAPKGYPLNVKATESHA